MESSAGSRVATVRHRVRVVFLQVLMTMAELGRDPQWP
jgi:hypothetical protein